MLDHDLNIHISFVIHVHKHIQTWKKHVGYREREREQEGEKSERGGGAKERAERGGRGGNRGRKGVFVSVGIIVFLLICVPRSCVAKPGDVVRIVRTKTILTLR